LIKEKVVGSEKDHRSDGGLSTRSARWGRRGVIASLLVGMGTLAAKSFSWLHFSPADGGEYRVIAQWEIAAGGKGLMIAISAHSAPEELRALGNRLHDKFHSVNNAAVMIFDDTAAAREVRKGSRNVDETRFQAALIHQRAMYLKSAGRGENSFTIYKSYPVVGEVMRFDDDLRKTSR
jgi:hypothetical protein